MKVLHTSDLHLGKSLLEESLFEDQKYMLNQIVNIVKENNIDVIMISGDIYDKSIPSVEATKLFNDFLVRLSNLNIEVLIIRGNHDSKDRLSFGSELFKKANIHIVSEYSGKIEVITKDDVNFYMLPFLKQFNIKDLIGDEYSNIKSSNDLMKWILNRENIDTSKKNIIMLHDLLQNPGENVEFSESESLNIGTLDSIDVNQFTKFNYVALGHIHKPQKVKEEYIRYSGTPIKYSFSECNNKNSVVMIDTDDFSIELIAVKPLREMRIIKDYFKNVINMEKSNDLIKVELLDEEIILSPMKEIRKIFPNAIQLAFVSRKDSSFTSRNGEILGENSPLDNFKIFYKNQYNEEMNDKELKVIEEILNDIEGEM